MGLMRRADLVVVVVEVLFEEFPDFEGLLASYVESVADFEGRLGVLWDGSIVELAAAAQVVRKVLGGDEVLDLVAVDEAQRAPVACTHPGHGHLAGGVQDPRQVVDEDIADALGAVVAEGGEEPGEEAQVDVLEATTGEVEDDGSASAVVGRIALL